MIVGTVSDDKMLLREALSLAVTVVAPEGRYRQEESCWCSLDGKGQTQVPELGPELEGADSPVDPPQ